MNAKLKNIVHECDFCVVGGGLAGLCAAIAAARHGQKVVLMHDRPMFGGNTSSEVRMWVSGAHGSNNRETGILEELTLENYHRNPYRTFPIWDSVLFEAVKKEDNITYLLNCSCLDCEMDGSTIVSVSGWQGTTQQFHQVKARFFADCSGDSILAPLSGAEWTMGREARSQYDESIAPEQADERTMGNTCLIQARDLGEPRPFIAPSWIRKITKEDLVHRWGSLNDPAENYWYLELGGMRHTIDEAEEIRDDLIALAFGMWDYIKNSGDCDADNWELDWVGFLPGKRESRRYIGDYVMTQNDIASCGKFADTVAFGGWTMDDHNPMGIDTHEPPNTFHPAPSPFGIPYRSLYSRNISNLFCAGRNISVTHSAMSATRVMATCATIGQAVGTAAAMCKTSPREVDITSLQQKLMEDGCFLPGFKMEASEIMKSAKVPAVLIDGMDRGDDHCLPVKLGESITIEFAKEEAIREIRILLDSDLDRKTVGAQGFLPHKPTLSNYPLAQEPVCVPQTLVKELKVETLDGKTIAHITDNYQRMIILSEKLSCNGIKITPVSTHGTEIANIFSVNVK